MNLDSALLRSIPISLAAALFVAALVATAKWRGRPLAARIEHALWTCALIAMLGFAIPRITIHAGPPVTVATLPSTGTTASPIAVPFDSPAVSTVTPQPASAPVFDWSSIGLWLWLVGASLMMLRIFVGVFLTHRSLANAHSIPHVIPDGASPSVVVLESCNAVVPMTVGWPDAQIVLPIAWRTWPQAKLRAVMLHELAHVRRRDPLFTFLAAINKAVFWFHPLAWWLERRLAELAEFAADDAAATSDRQDYAAILIDIASSAQPSRLLLHTPSVDFAQNGVKRISRRVDRILSAGARFGSAKIVWVAGIMIAAMSLLQFERPVHAQEAAPVVAAQNSPALTFDAASIRISTFGDSGLEGSKRSRIDVAPKSVALRNATLSECVQWAWNVKAFQISAPDAIRDTLDSKRYDIRAVVGSDTSVSQLRVMMQNLLTNRFQLALHHETRPMPVLELVVAKDGPKLPAPKPETTTHSAESLPRVENGAFVFADTTMAEFAAKLSLLRGVELPVIDHTGITGVYDVTLREMADAIRRDDAPPITTFLQDQLGLKLVAAKAPTAVLIVDRVGKLIENSEAVEPTTKKSPVFDAALVKPLTPGDLRDALRYRPSGGPGTSDPGRIRYPAITLQSLVGYAYNAIPVQIAGPDWLETEWFAVDATMPPNTTTAEFRTMLQNLLAERFKLAIHREAKEVAGYSLVVAAKGPKIKESVETPAPPDDGAPDPPPELGADGFFVWPKRAGSFFQLVGGPADARWTFREMTMAGLANELQPRLKGPVSDATGLTAKYDFVLTLSTTGLYLGKGPIRVAPDPNRGEFAPPDLFGALESQLGLRLEPKKVPVDVIVVDHMEKTPTGN